MIQAPEIKPAACAATGLGKSSSRTYIRKKDGYSKVARPSKVARGACGC
jgi:hypothetical protein